MIRSSFSTTLSTAERYKRTQHARLLWRKHARAGSSRNLLSISIGPLAKQDKTGRVTAALHRDEKGEENSLDFFIRARGREREGPYDEIEKAETSEKRQRKKEETKTLYPRTVACAKKTRFNVYGKYAERIFDN